MESADFESILEALARHDVEFILVGALSAVVQGAPLTTFDVDVVHDRSPANIERLLAALDDLDARYRNKPEIVPDETYLIGPGHQLLQTRFGPLDVLGEIEDSLDYSALEPHATPMLIGEHEILVLSAKKYLEFKRESSRAKDLAMVPLLEALLDEAE